MVQLYTIAHIRGTPATREKNSELLFTANRQEALFSTLYLRILLGPLQHVTRGQRIIRYLKQGAYHR